jgi:hypothetical protein
MKNLISPTYGNQGNFSPLRQSNALRSDDIPGARPRPRHGFASKNTQHYGERLISNTQSFDLKNMPDVKPSSPTQKKHYGIHFNSEIAQYNLMHIGEQAPRQLHEVEFPRNLSTKDIPGASPKTFHSTGVKNYYLAGRMRSDISSQNDDRNPLEDSLDKFQRERPQMRSSMAIKTNKSSLYEQESAQFKPQNHHYSLSQTSSPLKQVRYYNEERKEEEENPEMNQYTQNPQTLPNIQTKQNLEQTSNPKFFQELPPINQNQNIQPVQNSQQILQNQGYYQRPEENVNPQPNVEKNQYEPSNLYSFSPSRPQHSRIKSEATDMEKLTQDMIFQQRLLEKKMKEAWKGRAFNIVSNSPSTLYVNKGGNKYGSSIKALDRGQEYDRGTEVLNLKGMSPMRTREDVFKQANPMDSYQYSSNLADEQNPRAKKNDFKIY